MKGTTFLERFVRLGRIRGAQARRPRLRCDAAHLAADSLNVIDGTAQRLLGDRAIGPGRRGSARSRERAEQHVMRRLAQQSVVVNGIPNGGSASARLASTRHTA